MGGERSRRDLLGGLLGAFRDASRGAASSRPRRTLEDALRPPGALEPDEAFVAACTGCGDCEPACPVHAISMLPVAGGEHGLPAISPAAQPCVLCTELPCIAACPDGALGHPGAPERVRLGIARVDPRRCITFHGEHCDRCFRACPYPRQALMVIGGRPLVGSGACTGCGLCERACPEEPKAIRVIAERFLVAGLRVPKSEMQPG